MNNNPKQNWNCDKMHCTSPNGEVRLLPTGGGGNMIVCKACFEHEMRYRQGRAAEITPVIGGVHITQMVDPLTGQLPEWESLTIYENAEKG